jgi:hypothetical protein
MLFETPYPSNILASLHFSPCCHQPLLLFSLNIFCIWCLNIHSNLLFHLIYLIACGFSLLVLERKCWKGKWLFFFLLFLSAINPSLLLGLTGFSHLLIFFLFSSLTYSCLFNLVLFFFVFPTLGLNFLLIHLCAFHTPS